MRASYCGNTFRCKTIPECVLFTDSCMNVKIRVTLAFLSPLTRLHISKLLQRENCVFKKKNKKTKLKKDCGLVL